MLLVGGGGYDCDGDVGGIGMGCCCGGDGIMVLCWLMVERARLQLFFGRGQSQISASRNEMLVICPGMRHEQTVFVRVLFCQKKGKPQAPSPGMGKTVKAGMDKSQDLDVQ